MIRRTALPVAVGVAALVTLTACSGGTTTAATGPTTTSTRPVATTAAATTATSSAPLAADQVADAVKASLPQGNGVHVKGSISQDSVTFAIDVQANKGGTASGKLSAGGIDLPFIVANGTTYVQLTKSLVEHGGVAAGSATETAMLQKYVPATSKLVSDFATPVLAFGSYNTVVTGPLGEIVKLSAAGPAQVNGELADGYRDTDGSELFIENAAPHRLLRLVGNAKDPGQVDYTWGSAVPVAAPPASEIYTGPGA